MCNLAVHRCSKTGNGLHVTAFVWEHAGRRQRRQRRRSTAVLIWARLILPEQCAMCRSYQRAAWVCDANKGKSEQDWAHAKMGLVRPGMPSHKHTHTRDSERSNSSAHAHWQSAHGITYCAHTTTDSHTNEMHCIFVVVFLLSLLFVPVVCVCVCAVCSGIIIITHDTLYAYLDNNAEAFKTSMHLFSIKLTFFSCAVFCRILVACPADHLTLRTAHSGSPRHSDGPLAPINVYVSPRPSTPAQFNWIIHIRAELWKHKIYNWSIVNWM